MIFHKVYVAYANKIKFYIKQDVVITIFVEHA